MSIDAPQPSKDFPIREPRHRRRRSYFTACHHPELHTSIYTMAFDGCSRKRVRGLTQSCDLILN
jgi:hypothetical protein